MSSLEEAPPEPPEFEPFVESASSTFIDASKLGTTSGENIATSEAICSLPEPTGRAFELQGAPLLLQYNYFAMPFGFPEVSTRVKGAIHN